MKPIIGATLALVGWTAFMSLVAQEQGVGAQETSFLASYYSSGQASVTISARGGQVLSVLNVPSGIALSIHLVKGEFTPVDDKTGPVTFTGDVSIRTRPRSELVSGSSSRDQMMKAPLRLDVQDAVVAVLRAKK